MLLFQIQSYILQQILLNYLKLSLKISRYEFVELRIVLTGLLIQMPLP